jgi:hypothetical protein
VRHQVAHAKQTVDTQPGHKRRKERATKACASCIASKVKCDNSRPCKRCISKNIACETCMELSQRRTFPASNGEQNMTEESNLMPTSSGGGVSHSPIDVDEVLPGSIDYQLMNESPAQMQNLHGGSAISDDLRIFFEQIMVPELQSFHGEYLQPPPDLTAWMPEVDHCGALDLFGSSFVPSMDQIFEPHFNTQQISGTPGSLNVSDMMQPTNDRGNESTAQHRAAGIHNNSWCVNVMNLYAVILTRVTQVISHSQSARSDRA